MAGFGTHLLYAHTSWLPDSSRSERQFIMRQRLEFGPAR